MNEPNFWTDYAEAMQMSLEGNRLIAQELTARVSGLWKKATHAIEGLLHGLNHQHLPPM